MLSLAQLGKLALLTVAVMMLGCDGINSPSSSDIPSQPTFSYSYGSEPVFTEQDDSVYWGAGADSVLKLEDGGTTYTIVRHGSQGNFSSFDYYKNESYEAEIDVNYNSQGHATSGKYIPADGDWVSMDSTASTFDNCCDSDGGGGGGGGGGDELIYRETPTDADVSFGELARRCINGPRGVRTASVGAGVLALLLDDCDDEWQTTKDEGEDAAWATIGLAGTLYAFPGDPVDWPVIAGWAKEMDDFVGAIMIWGGCEGYW